MTYVVNPELKEDIEKNKKHGARQKRKSKKMTAAK
jgi:hypothetical protein